MTDEPRFTLADVKLYLLQHIRKRHGAQHKAAEHWGVSPTFVSKLVNNPDTPVPDYVLADMGLIKHKVTYFTRA